MIKGKKFAKKKRLRDAEKFRRIFFYPPAALLSKGHFYVKIHFSTRTIFSSAVKKFEVVVIQIFLHFMLRKLEQEFLIFIS